MILADAAGTLVAAALLLAFAVTLFVYSASPAYRARHEASARARKLLKLVLTPDEYRQVVLCGYLDVRSPSQPERIYRVPRSRDQVRVYEGGKLVDLLCLQAISSIPAGDIVLMHKLLIEGDESRYLTTANHLT
jgi:hypothetical protein